MASILGTLKVILGADVTGLKEAEASMLSLQKVTIASVNTMAQRIRTVGYLTTAVLTTPIIGAGKAMFKAASDFEFSMQKIVGLTGVAQDMADDWAESVKELSKVYGRSPQELAEALYFIASSGIQGERAMDVLKVSAKAAASGLGETQQVADLVTSALNAYAGTGLTAAQVTNQLVAAVKVGKAEADSFAHTIGQVIPLASEMGVSFGELAGGMAAITLTGSSAANAATYLKGVFNSLQTASEQGEKALNAVGSSYAKLRKILREEGLIALMQEIRDLTVDNEEALRDVLPNLRGLTAFLSIAGKNFQYNKEIINEVIGATRTADEAWLALSQTIKTQYNKQIARLKTVMVELGEYVAKAFLPILEEFTKLIEKISKWFSSLSESQKKFYLEIVALVAVLGPACLLLSSFIYTLTGLIGILRMVGKALMFIWAVVRVMSPTMWGLTTALSVITYLMLTFRKRGEEVDKSYKELNKTLEKTKKVLEEVQEYEHPEFQLEALFKQRTELDKKLNELQQLLKSYQIMAGLTDEEVAAGKRWGRWEKIAERDIKKIKEVKEALREVNEMINKISLNMAENVPKGVEKAVRKSLPSLADLKKLFGGIKEITERTFIDIPLIGFQGIIMGFKTITILNDRLKNQNVALMEAIWKMREEAERAEREKWQRMGFTGIPQLHLEGYYRNVELATDIFEKQMERQRQIASELTYIFQDLFMTIGEGWQAMINQIIQSIKRLAAEVMARLVVFTLLKVIPNLIAPGTGMLAGVTLEEFVFRSLGRGITRHARGNFVVPPGFPNDTYPAMLSSGEAVLTPMQLRYLTGVASTEGKVEFVIEGETLRGVLQKTNTKRNIY